MRSAGARRSAPAARKSVAPRFLNRRWKAAVGEIRSTLARSGDRLFSPRLASPAGLHCGSGHARGPRAPDIRTGPRIFDSRRGGVPVAWPPPRPLRPANPGADKSWREWASPTLRSSPAACRSASGFQTSRPLPCKPRPRGLRACAPRGDCPSPQLPGGDV